MRTNADTLKRYLNEYKRFNVRDKGRNFITYNDMQLIKDLILDARSGRLDNTELSEMDKYYMNELLETYEYFLYLITLIKKYKTNGPSNALLEDFINLSDNYSNRVEFYLARLLLTGDERLALKALAKENLIDKDYYCERIAFLLEKYRTLAHNDENHNSLYDLARHINLTNNTLSEAIEIYKKTCSDKEKDELVEMYRAIFSRNSDTKLMALEIINSNDLLALAHKYIEDGINEVKMNSVISSIKASKVLSLSESELAIIAKFSPIFKEEYRKVHPIEEEKKEKELKIEKLKITNAEAKEIMLEYYSSGKSKVKFCYDRGLSFEDFNECKKIYENPDNKNAELQKNQIEEICKKISEGIKNGITTPNGKKRRFDILDYYDITNYSPAELLNELSIINVVKGTTVHKYRNTESIKTTRKYLIDKQENYKIVVGDVVRYNVKFDENGKPVPNTGDIITKEESEQFMKYLRKIEKPVDNYTYNAVIKRYIEGNISFDEKVKTR